jgi:hypothetical protein
MLRFSAMIRPPRIGHEPHGDTGVGRGWRLAAIVALGLAVAGCDKCTNLFGPSKAGVCKEDPPQPR